MTPAAAVHPGPPAPVAAGGERPRARWEHFDHGADIGVRGWGPTSSRGVAEEAPGAYKDVAAVVDAADEGGLARKVARLRPLICIKG